MNLSAKTYGFHTAQHKIVVSTLAAFLQRGTTLVIFAVRRMTATWDCCQTLQRSTQYTESFLIFE